MDTHTVDRCTPDCMTQPEDIKKILADEAVSIVTGARRNAYGTPEDNFKRIADLWTVHLRNLGIIDEEFVEIEPRDVAVMMILMKIARLAESPDHRDSMLDLLGYTLCYAEAALPKVPKPVTFLDEMTNALYGDNASPFPVNDQKFWKMDYGPRSPTETETHPDFRVGDKVQLKLCLPDSIPGEIRRAGTIDGYTSCAWIVWGDATWVSGPYAMSALRHADGE